MRFLVVACLMLVAAVSSDDSDAQCRNDFQSFMQCAKQQHDQAKTDAAKGQMKQRVDDCFKQANCDAPQLDQNPMGGGGHKGGKGGNSMFNMPEAVKQCIKNKMMKKIGDKLNECLSKKGVKNVNFTAVMGQMGGDGKGDDAFGKGGKDAMLAKFNIVKGVRKCVDQSYGGDTEKVKPLEQCLHDTKKDIKPKICAALKPCTDKMSPQCKQRGSQVFQAICQCKQEKEADIARKLDALPKDKNTSISDLMKTVADGQDIDQMFADVEACYKDTNTPEPPLLKMARAFMSNGGAQSMGGRGGQSMSVDPKTIAIMRDMLQIEAKDQNECKQCDN